MEEYTSLVRAARILGNARREVAHDDGPCVISPAWTLLGHAQAYILKQAEALLRGDDLSEQSSRAA